MQEGLTSTLADHDPIKVAQDQAESDSGEWVQDDEPDLV